MGIFGKKKSTQMPHDIPPEWTKIMDDFRRKTLCPAVSFTAVRGETTVYSSKLGGVPYLPQGFDYPRSGNPVREERPMNLLAQLNFKELPELPDFPREGILQIYVDPDDLYGADFDHPTEQTGFRVIYHKAADTAPERLQSMPEMHSDADDMMPFAGEFLLKGERMELSMSTSDFRFDSAFLDVCRRHISTDAQRLWDLDEKLRDLVWEEFSAPGHRMGGYPYFTQEDPRSENGPYAEHTTLLLQIDSGGMGREDEILWGDCGVAGFFITPWQLREKDFSSVLYTWDCC